MKTKTPVDIELELSFSELLTIAENDGVSTAIERALDFLPNCPEKPKKPTINIKDADSETVLKYSEKLKKWESDMCVYQNNFNEYKDLRSIVDNVIVKLISFASGLNKIPEQYQEKVYAIAYSDGHSYGYYEVYLKLCKLVEIFE
jgi:hypothetical protein